MTLLATIAAQIWPYLLAIAGAAAAYFGVKAKGASDAKAAIAAEANKQTVQATQEVHDVEDKNARLSDDAVYDGLNKWVRDDKPSGK